MTIQFYVDDLKLLQVNEEVLVEEVNRINTKFRTNTQELNITTGYLHDYLGITIDYLHSLYVKITMYNYLQDILAEVDRWHAMRGTSVTPAQSNLFTVDKTPRRLDTKTDKIFHRIVVMM